MGIETNNLSIKEYIEALASKDPIPGGGGASGVAGALASALSAMVCNLTIGKKKYAEYENNIIKILDEMQEHIKNFIDLSDEDAKVFYPLSQAYTKKGETREETERLEREMEELLVNAADVPLRIMKEACWMIGSVEYLSSYGSRLAVSDVGVSISLIRASISSAMMNVIINTKLMKNRQRADEILKEADEMLEATIKRADEIYESVINGLRRK